MNLHHESSQTSSSVTGRCLDSLTQQRAASACTAGAGWHSRQHTVDVGHNSRRQTQRDTELALVAAGGSQVVEDLEAVADCSQAEASSRRKPGSGRQCQHAIVRTAVSTGSMRCSN